MAVNYRHSGSRINVSIPSGKVVTSGKEMKIKDVVGVPLEHGIAGQTVAFAMDGVWGLTVSIGGTLGVGTFLYYDYSADLLSVGRANDDAPFGQIVEVLDSTNKVYAVRLMINAPLAPLYA